jgi:hypothetical protein
MFRSHYRDNREVVMSGSTFILPSDFKGGYKPKDLNFWEQQFLVELERRGLPMLSQEIAERVRATTMCTLSKNALDNAVKKKIKNWLDRKVSPIAILSEMHEIGAECEVII